MTDKRGWGVLLHIQLPLSWTCLHSHKQHVQQVDQGNDTTAFSLRGIKNLSKRKTQQLTSSARDYSLIIRDPKIQRRERQKSNRINEQKQNFCRYMTLSCAFRCRHCTTTKLKCRTLRFMEEVNKSRRNFPFLYELGYCSQELSSRRVRLHVTK